ncbi:MAG: glucosyltransferase domain-containing protein [Prolixibacteraceae bacterium]|nr:glucosyltransferase domain-containing protein [Prolixibacteraceae bacterium]
MKDNIEIISSEILDFFRKNKNLILFSLFVAVICYGYELFNFTFSIDEEFDSFSRAVDHTRRILTERWGAYYLNRLLIPHSVLPYFPTLITLVCMAFTVVLFIGNAQGDFRSKMVFSVLFITFPLHAYYMTFNILNFSIGIGLLLTVLSFLSTRKIVDEERPKWHFFVFAVLLLTVSMSVYQGLMMVYAVVVLGHLLLKLLTCNENITFQGFLLEIGVFLIVFIASFISYKLVTAGLKLFYFGEVKTEGIYIDSFIMWGRLPVKTIFINLFHRIQAYLSGNAFYGSVSMKSLLLLVPFIIYLIFSKVKKLQFRASALFILGLLIIAPFGVMVYVGKGLFPRTVLALPFMLAIIWYISYTFLKKWAKRILLVGTIGIFFVNTNINTRLFYSTHVAYEADRDMANRIVERIYSLDLPQNQKKIPVAFVGHFNHPDNELFFKTDVFGASFFGWDNGRPARMLSLIRTLGEDRFKKAPEKKVERLQPEISKMPVWPYKGSVKKIKGVVVVKLSEE